MADLFCDMGHLEMAQGQLHTLMLLAPPAAILAEAQAMLGEIRRGLGDKEGAQFYFFLATETDPDASNPWASLGDMAREDGRIEEALRCYREALARESDAADIQVQLGYTLLDASLPEEAEQAFNTALESDPSEFSAYLGLSECYRKAHRHEDQSRMVREAMALAPDDPDVWNAKGVALEVQEQLSEATAAYEKALELDATNRKAANNLGFLLEKRMKQGEEGLRERALEAWKRRLLICRDEGQSLRMATEHLTRLGVEEDTIVRWLNHENTLSSRE
jgi:tetratricopeptide (TPR) repeat protein